MTPDDLQTGVVVAYSYLWRWQSDRNESEGRKDRPVCIVASVRSADGQTHLALLAISSRDAGADQVAIEVPQIECKRAGLSDWKQAWVTVSEYNYDIAERSFYLDPNKPILGRFSRSFMRKIADAAFPLFRGRQARIDRVD